MSNLSSKVKLVLLPGLLFPALIAHSQVDIDFSDHLPKGLTAVSNVHTFQDGVVQFQMGNTIFNMNRTGELVTEPYQSQVFMTNSNRVNGWSGDMFDNKAHKEGLLSDQRFTIRPDTFIVERLYSNKPNDVVEYALPTVTKSKGVLMYAGMPGKTVDFIGENTVVITEIVEGDCDEVKNMRSRKTMEEPSYVRLVTLNLEDGSTTQSFAFVDSAISQAKYPMRGPAISRDVQYAGMQGDMKLIWVLNSTHESKNDKKTSTFYNLNRSGTIACYGIDVFTGEARKLDEIAFATDANTASCKMSFDDGTITLQESVKVGEAAFQSHLKMYEVVNGKIEVFDYPFPSDLTMISPTLSEIKMIRYKDAVVPYFFASVKRKPNDQKPTQLLIFLDPEGTKVAQFNKDERLGYSEYVVNYGEVNTYIDLIPGGTELVDELDALLCRKYTVPFDYSFFVDGDVLKTFSICVDNRPAPGMSTKAYIKFRDFPLVTK